MNSTSPHEHPVFFVDRSLGRKVVPLALRNAGATVVAHDDVFDSGEKDEIWLKHAGRNRWIVLSSDKRIRYRINEREALLNADVRAFFLASKRSMSGLEMAQAFVHALPKIKRLAYKHPPPFIAHIWRDGTVKLMWPAD